MSYVVKRKPLIWRKIVKIIPNIPIVFSGSFPGGYVNDVKGWGFSRAEIEANRGKLGKMLTADIDFGTRCSLNCPACFRRNGTLDSSKSPLLTYHDTLNLIREAKKLGLRTVKFLGAGEPFEDCRLLQFLGDLKQLDIHSCIFTKGHVLGSDELAEQNFGITAGIHSAKQLVQAIAGLDVSILLSFQSFDDELQDSLVAVKGYTQKRNRAIELLCKYGFNRPNPTRLSLIELPLTRATIGEAFEIYRWGRERNIYPIVCPSMCSGRASDEAYRKSFTPFAQDIIDLYVQIYDYNISRGIQTLAQIREEGISAYAGAAPCSQVGCGMYITSRGIVLRCPGDDVTVLGDVRETSLEEIWYLSENYKRRGVYNCKCPPKDGKTIPVYLYEAVLARLMQ